MFQQERAAETVQCIDDLRRYAGRLHTKAHGVGMARLPLSRCDSPGVKQVRTGMVATGDKLLVMHSPPRKVGRMLKRLMPAAGKPIYDLHLLEPKDQPVETANEFQVTSLRIGDFAVISHQEISIPRDDGDRTKEIMQHMGNLTAPKWRLVVNPDPLQPFTETLAGIRAAEAQAQLADPTQKVA